MVVAGVKPIALVGVTTSDTTMEIHINKYFIMAWSGVCLQTVLSRL